MCISGGEAMIEDLITEIAVMLPPISRRGMNTIREVSITYFPDGTWQVMAGGHPAVAIGEWGGDFSSDGNSAEEALLNCKQSIIEGKR
jgi:hypothetical protein